MENNLRTIAVHFCEDCTVFFARLESNVLSIDFQTLTNHPSIKILHCFRLLINKKHKERIILMRSLYFDDNIV